MKNNRREFIKAGVLGGAALATGLPRESRAEEKIFKPLNILVLGGTGFLGPHMVSEALRRGHNVTLFNRGRSNNHLFPDLETIKGDRNNGLDGLKGRRWDAVIDNSGYVPRHVQDSARLLAANTDRYVYTSTVSVYADFNVHNIESSPLATMVDETIEEVTGETYGPLKALCEKRVVAEIDADKLSIIRPTYVCGPGDHTDRFSWWPIRTRRGGEMLWPGTPDDVIQIIDVRDLANFTVDTVDQNISGVFNAVNPANSYTMSDLLEDSQAVTGTEVEAHWVSEEFIYANELSDGRAFPIWNPKTGAEGGAGSFSGKAARDAGLHNRPERETARDLMAWWDAQSQERRDAIRTGLAAERETELIATSKKG